MAENRPAGDGQREDNTPPGGGVPLSPQAGASVSPQAGPAGTGPAGTGPAGTGPAGTGPAGTGPARGTPGAGFASGDVLDKALPGPSLAASANAAAGTGWAYDQISDDELIGVLGAWQRTESWAAAGLSAVAELIRRRPADACRDRATHGGNPARWGKFCADEVAVAMNISRWAAEKMAGLAHDLATRLPLTCTALREGGIDAYKAQVIAEATRCLDDAAAAAAEAAIIDALAGKTPGQIRALIARAVLKADPGAATEASRASPAGRPCRTVARGCRHRGDRQLRAAAGRGAGGRPADHDSGHGTQSGRGTRQYGPPPGPRVPRCSPRPGHHRPLHHRSPAPRVTATPVRPVWSRPATGSVPRRDPAAERPWRVLASWRVRSDQSARRRHVPRCTGGASPGRQPGAGQPARVSPTARLRPPRINLTVPLATLLGLAEHPGEASGFGPIDPALARALAAQAAGHPATSWCVTVTDSAGHPVAHGCGRSGRRRQKTARSTGPARPDTQPSRNPPGGTGRPGSAAPPAHRAATSARTWQLQHTARWAATGPGGSGLPALRGRP